MTQATTPSGVFGPRILSLADRLARHSEDSEALTCTFLTPAHQAAAAELRRWMAEAGLDVAFDDAGNVVGRLPSPEQAARTVIIGSHYDTVIDAGRYDGRLGILAGLAVIEELRRQHVRLPFHLELIAFSEEEGVRFATPYIGSSAVAGRFDPDILARRDAVGVTLAEALRAAGHDPGAIATLGRRQGDLLAYLELHIEQGPVLLGRDAPLGVVTAIAGAVRQRVAITGSRNHAGTTPMTMRHDALAAAAEIVLLVERRCQGVAGLVGTVGTLEVAGGAVNVVAGACTLSLDIRAGDDATRDAALADIHAGIGAIAQRRGVTVETTELMRMEAVPCSPGLRTRFAEAIARARLPAVELPSGAGHDAVMFRGLTDIGMLFVRCGNGGISHSPLETIAATDAEAAASILFDVLANWK